MPSNDAPLYLHFLDRELNNSLKLSLPPSVSESVIKTLILGTNSYLYCGFSLLWESPSIDRGLRWLISELIKASHLDTISHHSSVDEFVASRQRLYSHVPGRYPMYFEDIYPEYLSLSLTDFKRIGTTTSLEKNLKTWKVEAEVDLSIKKALHQTLKESLHEREGRAITFDLFQHNLKELPQNEPISAMIKKKISLEYTSHYLKYGNGDIATGIQGLGYFDQISTNFPYYDIPILQFILSILGLSKIIQSRAINNKKFWQQLISQRFSREHLIVSKQIRSLLMNLYDESIREFGKRSSEYSMRRHLQSKLITAVEPALNDQPYKDGEIYKFMLSKLNKIPKLEYLSRIEIYEVDVLLMTTVPVETEAVHKLVKEKYNNEIKVIPASATENAYYDLGEICGKKIFMVESGMGSIGPIASTLTTYDGIYELNPKAIILLGIAFGIDDKEQKIGDILLSEYVLPYERSKVGTDAKGEIKLEPSGDKVPSSARLFNNFKTIGSMWERADVIPGVVLSGEKLIDNIDYRDQIASLNRHSVGGEMEGAGLYSACQRKKVNWLIVKAISDWADGKKRKHKKARQKKAATSAAEFILDVITKVERFD